MKSLSAASASAFGVVQLVRSLASRAAFCMYSSTRGQSAASASADGAAGSGKDFPLAPYGHVWRAGANEATKFTVADDVLVNGQPLKAGSYSLHMIPGKDEWTVIFNRKADQWGSYGYDAKEDADADSERASNVLLAS